MFKLLISFCLGFPMIFCHAADLSYAQWRAGWTVLDAGGVLSAWHGAQLLPARSLFVALCENSKELSSRIIPSPPKGRNGKGP